MKYLLIFVCAFFAEKVLAQDIQLTLASDIWVPFTNVEGEKAISRDIVNQALARSGIHVKTEISGFDEVISGIKNKHYDGSAALWLSEDRKEFLTFSMPYLHNQLVLVARKGSDVSTKDLHSLEGKKVALVSTYAYGDIVAKAENKVEFVLGESDQENLTTLLKEKVDYMLVDQLLIQYLMTYQKEEVSKYLEVGKNTILQRSLHFALRKDIKDADLIIDAFNKNIIKMMGDGSYNRILELNWIKTDVNGDGQQELVLLGNQAGKQAPSSSYDVLFDGNQNSVASSGNGFYIQGKLYKNWDDIPNEYKVPVNPDDMNKVKILNFGF